MTNEVRPPQPMEGVVLPPEARTDVRMPRDTPLGMGFLGALRLASIRMVLDERERTLEALAREQAARAEANLAIVRRVRTEEQLRDLDTIRQDERNRLQAALDDRVRQEKRRKEYDELEEKKHAYAMEVEDIRLARLKLDRLELDIQLLQAEERLGKVKAARERESKQSAEFEAVMNILKEYPGMVEAAEKVKEEVKKTKGEDHPDLDTDFEQIDSLIRGVTAKRGEGLAT